MNMPTINNSVESKLSSVNNGLQVADLSGLDDGLKPVTVSLRIVSGKPEKKRDFTARAMELGLPRGESERSFYNQLNAHGLAIASSVDITCRNNGFTVARSHRFLRDKSGRCTGVSVTYVAPKAPRLGKQAKLEAENAELRRQVEALSSAAKE